MKIKSIFLSFIALLHCSSQLPLAQVQEKNTRSKTFIDKKGYLQKPHGLFSVAVMMEDLPNEKVWDAPGVDGLLLKFGWRQFHPQQNEWDWTLLDKMLDKAVEKNKQISLGVAAGKFTPSWVYEKGASKLHVDAVHAQGRGECFSFDFPAPWDEVFLKSWESFLQALAKHIRTNTLWAQKIALIKLTGINMDTVETRQPMQTLQSLKTNSKGCPVTDTNAMWSQSGYRPSKVISAWQRILLAFKESFPDNSLSFSIIVGNQDFPSINEEGDMGKPQNLTETLLVQSHRILGSQLIVQHNSLDEESGTPPLLLKARDEMHIPIGLQVDYKVFGKFSCKKNCDGNALTRTIQKSIENKSLFLEIFERSVLAYPQAMKKGQSDYGVFHFER